MRWQTRTGVYHTIVYARREMMSSRFVVEPGDPLTLMVLRCGKGVGEGGVGGKAGHDGGLLFEADIGIHSLLQAAMYVLYIMYMANKFRACRPGWLPYSSTVVISA